MNQRRKQRSSAPAAAASSPAPEAAPWLQGTRDLRIDFLRGLIMVSVVVTHLEYFSAFSYLVWERVGIVSSAGGFVVFSGLVLGLVHGRAARRGELHAASLKVLGRALQLYRVLLVVIAGVWLLSLLPFVDASTVTSFTDRGSGTVYPLYPHDGAGWRGVLSSTFKLQCGPHQFQVIGLYVVLMTLAPLMLLAIREGRTRWLLGLSWALYFATWNSGYRVTPMQFEYAFPITAWQLLFVHGLVAGAHWDKVCALLFGPRGGLIFAAALLVSLGFALLAWNHPMPEFPDWAKLHWLSPEQFGTLYSTWFQKTTMGLGRIANDAALFVVLIVGLSRYWTPLSRALGWYCIPIGQASLYVFVVQVGIVMLASNLLGKAAPGFWLASLVHLLALALVWLMVRYRVLFNIIPR